MHILVARGQTLDELDRPVDLDQTCGDIVVLSFTDSDLSAFAAAAKDIAGLPSLRFANLARLRHPMSVDLYIERVVQHARVVLVRLLGGVDYWRYGAEQLFAVARERNIALAFISGDGSPDERLAALSTVPPSILDFLRRACAEGGSANLVKALCCAANLAGAAFTISELEPLPAFGAYEPGLGVVPFTGKPHSDAVIVFYRALLFAGDLAAIDALYKALAARRLKVDALFVTSLKDDRAGAFMREALCALKPSVILNTTAFSARAGANDGSPLDEANVPVLQTILAGSSIEAWREASRGLSAADLTMNVVLPEIDGRILAGAVSFKREAEARDTFEFNRTVHAPHDEGLAHAADLALSWARLGAIPRARRRIAILLPDYPGRAGRAGSGVGLDGPSSAVAILKLLQKEGYTTGDIPSSDELFRLLTGGDKTPFLDGETYKKLSAALPHTMREEVIKAWGEFGNDPDYRTDAFHNRIVVSGNILIAVQPDRASNHDRKARYHDPLLPPCHGYIAFHLWLKENFDALVMLGAHGTLEWLPGKAVALSGTCFPRALTGTIPVLYPFIVTNPGEAAQAKRRIAAVTIGHLAPPMIAAGVHGAAADIEPLIDEFAQAQTLDPRRANRLAGEILSRAYASGLAAECGLDTDLDKPQAIAKLDAWLCELKEMRIRDGQHIYGMADCGPEEREALLAGLDGKFIRPGPGGAPSRTRADVLPTGRNLFSVDPRSVPTRTAMDLGVRAATELVTRYLQMYGDWPHHVVLDLWASTTMRTGGEDLAQAFALIGARPQWDQSSTRVSGFEIVPSAKMEWPRVDVTLRISGLFRDAFPMQIALFDAAAAEIAKLDESHSVNCIAAAASRKGSEIIRVFGPAPGAYGSGLSRIVSQGDWEKRHDLAEAYTFASAFAYGRMTEGKRAETVLRERLSSVDAVVHVTDIEGTDMLESDEEPLHVGGLAAAIAAVRGKNPALYESDTHNPEKPVLRTYEEAVARAVRGRAANPRWIEAQKRHGASGAAQMANALDALFAYAATAGEDCTLQFSVLFDAYIGDTETASFLRDSNPAAFAAMLAHFDEAIRRGLWKPLRNSVRPLLAGEGRP